MSRTSMVARDKYSTRFYEREWISKVKWFIILTYHFCGCFTYDKWEFSKWLRIYTELIHDIINVDTWRSALHLSIIQRCDVDVETGDDNSLLRENKAMTILLKTTHIVFANKASYVDSISFFASVQLSRKDVVSSIERTMILPMQFWFDIFEP